MADRPDPYVRKDPNDIIRSGDWNELQIQAREDILSHTHTGKHDGKDHGSLLPGAAIDPTAEVNVTTLSTSNNLTVNGDLKVKGKALLGDIDDLLAMVKSLRDDKLNRAGDTVSGNLSIQQGLVVGGDLDVTGGIIRKISVVSKLGPNDETDNGQIVSRVLPFTKRYAATAIRILYCDNFRVRGGDANGPGAASWEIRIDGQSPPGGVIRYDRYSLSGNHHEQTTVIGYARGISPGAHTIGVWVGPVQGYSICDAYTGWAGSSWTLEAQELWIPDIAD
ncbi:MAG: hypothetical protein DVS81_02720 [Candidatus Accumulibacter meliphilus]|jgi:hypothetical protein|uniref:CTHRC1 C-terminal domain-containing protein n=1 Tax=Candidatus Accumulibacter meliphilus TaxID=2211374 RepID=A0A369XPT3_9PROT|nr:MAG: hypothetical protein DVS81_02720 [Candidatus Accumulibacter meliphilus]